MRRACRTRSVSSGLRPTLMSLTLTSLLGHADLAIKIAAGATVFIGALFALWTIAGRPQSPEQDALDIIAGLRRAHS